MTKKMVNGVIMDMTPEEETQRETDIANAEARRIAQAEAEAQAQADKEAKDTLKASAKAKLIAGEPLTEEEANTIVI
tara:strand:- start:345 stop:575 length:231 start_codon:yes stop_codon:yes gene_type:complete